VVGFEEKGNEEEEIAMGTENALLTSIKFGNRTLPNRFAINAMEGCDADTGGNPTATAFRRYERLARGNAGLIIVEALSVVDENRGRDHQLTALPQNQKGLADLVSTMRRVNPKPAIIWQLTHSGELSNPEFSERVCVKPFPGYEGRLLSEEEVDEILERFVFAAKMASDCGADGVDFKLCHGYLGSQLVRPYNDRKWKYGGSWGNRTRFAYEFYERVAREVKNRDFIVGSKISAWEGLPGGMGTASADSPIIDLTEVLDLVKGLEARGATFIVQSAGNPSLTLALTQPDRKVPDYAYLHFWFQKEFKKVMKKETVLIGSAYSLFRDGKNSFRGVRREEASLLYWGDKNIREGVCDMVAIGRQSLADPLLPSKVEEGKINEIKWCTGCDSCVEFLIRQRPVGCSTYEKEYTRALQEIRKEQGSLGTSEKHT
jgi:2,4-dienoyl-CoA reductase-like NADH-dependent reductase (Old Yellow Enzyme family)